MRYCFKNSTAALYERAITAMPQGTVNEASGWVLPPSAVTQAARARSSSTIGAVLTSKDGGRHANPSRKVSRRVASPACIAGVRVSRPNFRAPCRRRKLLRSRTIFVSVGYWYQTLPTARFPTLPDRDNLEII